MSKKICACLSVVVLFLLFMAPNCDQRKLPDLIVDSITFTPINPTTNGRILLEAVIKNNGTKAAAPSQAAMRVGGETYPQTFNIPTLQPEAVHNIQRTLPPCAAAGCRVTVYADYTGVVIEKDETNNQKYKSFK
jgi:subtilase family serine protease